VIYATEILLSIFHLMTVLWKLELRSPPFVLGREEERSIPAHKIKLPALFRLLVYD
jgi:hypothetical protein